MSAGAPMGRATRRMLAAGVLVVLVAGVFGRVRGFDFVDYDDGEYVYANPQVLAGLGADGLAWAFTTTHAANWHPLTWLSHMLDVQLFGPDPSAHHVVNVALHAANAALLFLVLEALTGALAPSLFAAALFAVHPLHVESVAWVSERKDLLCALFFLLGLGAYSAHVRRGGVGRYALVVLFLVLALLSKPMAVTFPFVLLLLDIWPLRRLERGAAVPRLLWEKAPLVALAALSATATLMAQASRGAVAATVDFPTTQRLANAVMSYAVYLRQALWPSGLAVFYPHPSSLHLSVPIGSVLAATAVLAALTLGAAALARRRPWLLVGWLWYLGMLVPVVGVLQVGAQAHADRYAYLPLVGVFVGVAFGAHGAMPAARLPRGALATLAVAAVAALAVAARDQVGVWRDRETLYTHALAVTEDNWLAWNNLGMLRLERSELDAALAAFDHAILLNREFADAWYNAGVALQRQGRHARAIAVLREALRLHPADADAWVNLGISYRAVGARAEAVHCQSRGLELRAGDPLALEELRLLEAPGASRPFITR